MSDDIFCQAIASRRIVRFFYDASWRSAEPHIVGLNLKGRLALSAWQLSGGSGTGWREFLLSKLSSPSLTDATFARPRRGYNPNDPNMGRIICRL